MAVEVTTTQKIGGELQTEKFTHAVNFHVDQLGHLYVLGWDGVGDTNIAVYKPDQWVKANVIEGEKNG